MDSRLREMWALPLTLKAMRAELGYSEPSISQRAGKLGLAPRGRKVGMNVGGGYSRKPQAEARAEPALPVFTTGFIRPLTKAELMVGRAYGRGRI